MRGLAPIGANRLAAFIVASLIPVGLAMGAETAEARFSAALAEAKVNLTTKTGREYDRVLSAHLVQKNAPILSRCIKTTGKPDASAFEIVFRVAASGTVLEALVWPESKIGVCLKDGLSADSFPPPPKDAYWAHMRMSFGP